MACPRTILIHGRAIFIFMREKIWRISLDLRENPQYSNIRLDDYLIV